MPILIDDTTNPAATSSSLNLKQILNSFAFVLKQVTGQADWKTPPSVSLTDLSQIDHQHLIAQVQGLQAALDDKAASNHQHSPTAWQNLTLSPSWVNYGTGYITPQCRKFVGDLVEVKGVIKKSSALVTNEVIATLPTGYRPSEIMLVTTWASGGTSRIQVEPSGAIRVASGNNAGVGVSFFFGL